MKPELVKNAVGRLVPQIINDQKHVPFQGIGKFRPTGRKAAPLIPTCIDYPSDGNKVVSDLKTALQKCGLR
ncbi:MAG: citrate lyase subunit alpha, partial [Candidatus Neomarinimicrobiota bacterium]